ncbi:MAG: sporulation protein YqfD [Clostridia bacterium]|nr:sporulation protein YqfD [Clostridia bacterium]
MSGIRLRITGLNFQHFFARARRENVGILSTKRIDTKTLEITLALADYPRIKDYLYKFFKVETIGYTGRRAIKPLIVKNIGLVIGIFIAILGALLSTQFVWRIEVYGLEATSRTTIITALDAHNVREGHSFNADITSLENSLLQQLDTIADISITKRGTTIIVSVSEKLVFSPTTFDPMYSDYTGIVQSIELSSGTLAVNSGDFVHKGDPLVLPFILDNDGREVSVRPVAKVTIMAQVTGVSSVASREKVITYTGREEIRSYYQLGKIKLKNTKTAKPFDFCDKIVYNQTITNGNLLPLYKVSIVYREYKIDYIERKLADIEKVITQESVAKAEQQVIGDAMTKETKVIEIADIYYATTTMTFIVEQC